MVTYLDVLNRARARQGNTPISAVSIGDNSGDSLQAISALNSAVAIFYDNSFDLDSGEQVSTISTTIGTSLLTPPTDTWDTNVISTIKYQKSGVQNLIPLTLIDLESSEDVKLQTFTTNDPVFWWVNQTNIYILPVPSAMYTLKAFYQKLYPDITNSNVTGTILLPDSALKTLTDLTYAFLREQLGDPQWEQLKSNAEQQVIKFYQRNKHTYKSKGFRKFTVRARSGDRRL